MIRVINTDCRRNWYYPLASPSAKPTETLDTSVIPIFDSVPGWLAPIVLETCVIAFVTQSIPFCEIA
jgi:hypothetical protein